jgi:hypothetical protein
LRKQGIESAPLLKPPLLKFCGRLLMPTRLFLASLCELRRSLASLLAEFVNNWESNAEHTHQHGDERRPRKQLFADALGSIILDSQLPNFLAELLRL